MRSLTGTQMRFSVEPEHDRIECVVLIQRMSFNDHGASDRLIRDGDCRQGEQRPDQAKEPGILPVSYRSIIAHVGALAAEFISGAARLQMGSQGKTAPAGLPAPFGVNSRTVYALPFTPAADSRC